jgi:PleD family two-component response regulator
MRLAARMVSAVTREMDLIARYEHDCLSILLPHVAIEQGVGVLRRVRQSLEMSELGSVGGRLPLSLRTGVAEVADGDDPLGLFGRARAALRSQQDHRGGETGPARPAPAAPAPAVCFDPPTIATQQTDSTP